MPNTTEGDREAEKRPALEWVVGVLSAIAVCAIIVFLAYEAMFGDTRPPTLAAAVSGLEEVEGGTLVFVALSNRGDQAAASVVVEASIDAAGSEPIRKELTFDYVPSRAVERGAIMVEESEVIARDIVLSVHGYVEP